jgi:hypothetical protein
LLSSWKKAKNRKGEGRGLPNFGGVILVRFLSGNFQHHTDHPPKFWAAESAILIIKEQ